jgi:hypothetical protein
MGLRIKISETFKISRLKGRSLPDVCYSSWFHSWRADSILAFFSFSRFNARSPLG